MNEPLINFEEKLAEFNDRIIAELKQLTPELYEYIKMRKNIIRIFKLSEDGIYETKMFERFMRDPSNYLKNRGISSIPAIRRTIYENYIFLLLLSLPCFSHIIFPEDYIDLSRKKSQKWGEIPPNCILEDKFGTAFSFFLQAPRPTHVHDADINLRKLYLRPDILVLKGYIKNLIETTDPELKLRSPLSLIECKESTGWWSKRVKKPYWDPDRGPVKEWWSCWRRGIADMKQEPSEKRLSCLDNPTELDRLLQYLELFNPQYPVLVAKEAVPQQIKEFLTKNQYWVIDATSWSSKKIETFFINIFWGFSEVGTSPALN